MRRALSSPEAVIPTVQPLVLTKVTLVSELPLCCAGLVPITRAEHRGLSHWIGQTQTLLCQVSIGMPAPEHFPDSRIGEERLGDVQQDVIGGSCMPHPPEMVHVRIHWPGNSSC